MISETKRNQLKVLCEFRGHSFINYGPASWCHICKSFWRCHACKHLPITFNVVTEQANSCVCVCHSSIGLSMHEVQDYRPYKKAAKNTMQKYYECHITFIGSSSNESDVKNIKWKFSIIDGDPILGKGLKCYATRHFPARLPREDVIAHLTEAATQLRNTGINVIREKVELVVYDTKNLGEVK